MAHSPEKVDSVYDFLYVDTKRIELLLAQFGTDGVLTEMTRTTDTTNETGGGFDLKLAKMDHKEGEKSGLTRRFDPRSLTPLIFLREAYAMIGRDISKARIGQLVLAGGLLSISDLNMLRQLWDVPILQAAMAQQWTKDDDNTELMKILARQQRAGKGNQQNPKLAQVKALLDFVKILPHGMLATISDAAGRAVWCTLRSDSLVMPSSDLMLNHGAVLGGTWHIVGIVDALPAAGGEPEQMTSGNPLMNMMAVLGPITRQMLGRPDMAYGVTPLVIFREIK